MEQFPLKEDIELVQELLGLDSRELGSRLGISRMTLNRWAKNPGQASWDKLDAFYGFAFSSGIRLNEIHAQLFIEESRERGLIPLFHGSKQGIASPLSASKSRMDNDFGQGFYCGESFAQAAMFVSRYPQSVCYFAAFDAGSLTGKMFSVDDEWMLAVALHRGKLDEYADHRMLQEIKMTIDAADYIVAPIADNRMFQIIDSFMAGEITDEQCRHSLSATNLGFQYVLKSPGAIGNVVRLQPHFLSGNERTAYLSAQQDRVRLGADKVKAAKRTYRAQGRYIEELLS